MLFNGLIFNETVNINEKINNINLIADDADVALSNEFDEIRRKITAKEADIDDLRDSIKKYTSEGESVSEAKNDAIDDAMEMWADGSLQLNFIPENSLLCGALKQYYAHLDDKLGKKAPKGFISDIERYPRSGVWSDDNNIMDQAGFFFATGLGYDTSDELFAGVPVKNSDKGVGSGIPSRKFIDYINKND